MKRHQREAIRARAEGGQRRAREDELAEREKKARLEESARTALMAHEGSSETRFVEHLEPGAQSLIRTLLNGPPAGRKLVTREMKATLCRLGATTSLRAAGHWRPQGKGRDTVFRSLCEHLLAKFPTPRFLWAVFDESDQNAAVLVPLVVHVASGGSLFQFCKSDKVPFTLTRAQCQEFMSTPANFSIVAALRRVQVKSEGGDQHLFEVWRNLERNKTLGTAAEEAFRVSVLRFFARNPMLSREHVGPLCDYVFQRYRENPTFSIQGRTVAALTRAMTEWHRALGQERRRHYRFWEPVDDRPPVKFEKSGFRSYRLEKETGDQAKRGFVSVVVWTIQEIISSEELRAEGKEMHHCVYSYRSQIESKETSIWSLSMTEEFNPLKKLATLEVNNRTRAVVQARGPHNRPPKPPEDKVIIEWASRNGLTISYGKAW